VDLLRGIQSIETIPLEGRRVLVRSDLDCPLAGDDRVSDDSILQAALPTIRYGIEQGARIVVAAHLGNPGGKRVPELSILPVAERLADLLSKDVFVPEDCVGDGPRKLVMERVDGDVVILENLRFCSEEETNDDVFAQRLASLADVYVNDAFRASGTAHASVEAICRHVSVKAAGLQMVKELTSLGRVLVSPEQPFMVVLGGARASDKLGVLASLLGKARCICIGGAVATSFLAAKGLRVGRSEVEGERFEAISILLSKARIRGVDIVLPTDVLVCNDPDSGEAGEIVPVHEIPPDGTIVDIGPESVREFASRLGAAKTVLWNGPMGMWERRQFLAGTEALGKAIAHSRATSIVGGEDTVAAVSHLVLKPFFSHVSLGGDSTLRFLEGRDMPGVDAIREVD
jgi:phosphoglycerate kinase